MGNGRRGNSDDENASIRDLRDTELRQSNLERKVCELTDIVACLTNQALLNSDLLIPLPDPCGCGTQLYPLDCSCARADLEARVDGVVEWDSNGVGRW